MVWDFDQTLIPGYMQRPLFAEYDIDPSQFWAEANALPDQYGERDVPVTPDSAYLNHMLSYTWEGKFPDLSNEKPRSYGAKLDFYDGMPEFMECIATAIAEDAKYRHHEIRVEHYIVSTGLRQIIEGSPIRDKVRDVWASEFIEQPLGLSGQMRLPVGDSPVVGGPAPTITQIGYAIDNTTKTRALFEINKGVNVEPEIDVNGVMPESERRVPLPNMICIADGPSDVPMFSVVKRSGGKTFAVYDPGNTQHFDQVSRLVEQERVIASFPADYSEDNAAWLWLHRAARQIADEIVKRREAALSRATASGPRHVAEETAVEPQNGSTPGEAST